MYGGGAAKCHECRLLLLELSTRSDVKFEEGACYYAIAGGRGEKGCVQPRPTLCDGRTRAIWKLWERTFGQDNAPGMEGRPRARSIKEVREACLFLGIPADEWTLTAYQLIQVVWLKQFETK